MEKYLSIFFRLFTSENQIADGMSKHILEQLDIIRQGNCQKLLAQTFDGSDNMKCKKAGVQAKIKAVYTNIHLIQCYCTHQLNLLVRNAAGITQNKGK